MASFTDWMRPLNELPKTPELVEEKLQDISDHHQQLFQDTQECADTGRSLANRLSRPVLQEPEFVALNERLQESQRFLHAKVSELEKRSEEVQHILPQQEALLREFITYCHFERKIEHILLWLQKTGLKKLPMFSTVGDDRDSVQKQVLEFESFREEADSLSVQVSELDSTAADIEAQIGGFKSDLTRKTGSLRAVWQKFLQRVQNRGSVLNLALSFHTTLEQVNGNRIGSFLCVAVLIVLHLSITSSFSKSLSISCLALHPCLFVCLFVYILSSLPTFLLSLFLSHP